MTQSTKLKNEDLTEVVVDIYESLDNFKGQNTNTEPVYSNITLQAEHPEGRSYKQIAVGLGLLCVLLLTAVIILSVTFQRRSSQLGWIYNASSFYYVSDKKNNFYEARNDCKGRGADLVIINSKDEQNFVDKVRKGQKVWIGATDEESEGIWKWVDGSALTTQFWLKGEPNNYNNEDCAISGYVSIDVQNWADSSCLRGHELWICEKNMF